MDAAERVRRLAMVARVGAVAKAVLDGDIEASEDSRRAGMCMQVAARAHASGYPDAAISYLEQAYQASSSAYDAASPEQRAIMDQYPTPSFALGDREQPPSPVGSLLRRIGRGRRKR